MTRRKRHEGERPQAEMLFLFAVYMREDVGRLPFTMADAERAFVTEGLDTPSGRWRNEDLTGAAAREADAREHKQGLRRLAAYADPTSAEFGRGARVTARAVDAFVREGVLIRDGDCIALTALGRAEVIAYFEMGDGGPRS